LIDSFIHLFYLSLAYVFISTFIHWNQRIHTLALTTLLAVNERRQVLSQDVLRRTGKEQSKDVKNLKQMTKTIIDRFFNSPSPPHVQVHYLTASHIQSAACIIGRDYEYIDLMSI